MAFLDELGVKITQSGLKTKQKASDLKDMAKLNAEANELKKLMQAYYGRLGEKYFELHGDSPEAELEEFVTVLKEACTKMEIIQVQLNHLKNTRNTPVAPQTELCFCSACGNALTPGASFCSKCGNKIF